MNQSKKYVVLRRDGSVPPWPYLVLSLGDEAAQSALRAYVAHCERENYDPDYLEVLKALDDEGQGYRAENPQRARPDGMQVSREDHPLIVGLLETGDLAQALAEALPAMLRQKIGHVGMNMGRRLVRALLLP